MKTIWIIVLDAIGLIVGLVVIGTFFAMIWQFISNLIIKRRWKHGRSKDLTGSSKPEPGRSKATDNRPLTPGVNEQGKVGGELGSKSNSSINRQEHETYGTGIDRVKRLLDKRRAGQ